MLKMVDLPKLINEKCLKAAAKKNLIADAVARRPPHVLSHTQLAVLNTHSRYSFIPLFSFIKFKWKIMKTTDKSTDDSWHNTKWRAVVIHESTRNDTQWDEENKKIKMKNGKKKYWKSMAHGHRTTVSMMMPRLSWTYTIRKGNGENWWIENPICIAFGGTRWAWCHMERQQYAHLLQFE